MKSAITIILILTQVSVIFTTIQVYLRINKIWKRKHEREVADSQSIAGLLLLIANCILWIFYYIWVEDDLLSVVDTSLYLIESAVFMLISTGLWVKGKETRNLWQLIKIALKLERKEANYLLKKVFKPANADVIIRILHQLAMIDDDLDPKERKMIEAFANEWNIEYSASELNEERVEGDKNNFIKLRESVENFLNSEPPKEQAGHLKDMIQALVEIDDMVTEEEELIKEELIGMIENYISKGELNLSAYYVLIVPQNKKHHSVVKTIMPDAEEMSISGGMAYSVGTYYSKRYAELISEQYREINLFTIVHNPET